MERRKTSEEIEREKKIKKMDDAMGKHMNRESYSLDELDLDLFGKEYQKRMKKEEEEKRKQEEAENKKKEKDALLYNIIKEIKIFKRDYESSLTRDKFLDKVIESNSPKLCIEFAKVIGGSILSSDDIERLGKVIIESKDAELCEDFVRNFTVKNKKDYEDIIIKSKNLAVITDYAMKNGDANKKAQNVVFNCGDFHRIIIFCKNVEGADIKKAQEIIYNSDNYDEIISFAANVKGADIKKAEEIILGTKSPKYCSIFAIYVKDADISKLHKYVKDTKYDSGRYYEVYSHYRNNVLPRENTVNEINELIKKLSLS